MTRLNILAALFLLVSAPVGLLLRYFVAPGNDAVAILIAATMMTLLDLGYRFKNEQFRGKSKWISMGAGAYLVIFPLWGWGLALIVIALVQLTTNQAIF
jgi:multisubunit Na+/H+ antiporter MnhB subunit